MPAIATGALVASLGLFLGACSVGPDFTSPKPPDAAKWNDPSASRSVSTVSTQANPDPQWWGVLGDATLTALIEKAIAGNLDLQQAVLRVVEAQQGEETEPEAEG